jgi:6,7-dimethyl-8-ribityllumazine synthase
MSSADKNLSAYKKSEIPSASDLSFGIITSEWNEEITDALYKACFDTLIEHGAKEENIHSIWVPGTFELPAGARMLAQKHKLDALVCLGCVIKGETSHNEYINQSVAQALQNMAIASGKPFIFGVLTPNSMQQALDRAGGVHGNKGVEAAVTAIKMAALKKSLGSGESKIGF